MAANDVGFDVKQHAFNFDAVELNAFSLEAFHGGGVGFAASLCAALFVANLVSSAQFFFGVCFDLGNEAFVLGRCSPIPCGFASIAHQFVNGVDRNVALLVTKHHSTQHDLFRQLLRFRFHHQHGSFGTGNDQVHLAVFALCLTGVQHVFAVDVTHARSADRAIERHARNRQCSADSDQSCDVGINFRVQRNGVHHHVHVVVEAFWEQRTNRTVDQAAGKGLQLAGLGFTLEEAAGNLAGCVCFLNVVHGQGEKVLTSFGIFRSHHCGQNHGVFDVDQHSAGCLACNFASFHDDLVLAPLEGFCHFVKDGHVE